MAHIHAAPLPAACMPPSSSSSYSPSPSHLHVIPHITSHYPLPLPLPLPHYSRFVISRAAVPPRNNITFDPNKDNDDNNDDNDNVVFLRRRRRKPRGGGNGGGRRSRQPSWSWSWSWSDHNREEGGGRHGGGGIVQQLVRNLFVLQVFKSYGWFLPIILISFLLATGPKAFLIGSGISFGLSMLAFLFNIFSDWLNSISTTTPKPSRRHKYSRRKSSFSGQKQAETEQSYTESKGNNGFGGWDELLVTEDDTKTTKTASSTKDKFETMTMRKPME